MGKSGGGTMTDDSLFLALLIVSIGGFISGIFAGFAIAMKGGNKDEDS